jgi:hypothetical protein
VISFHAHAELGAGQPGVRDPAEVIPGQVIGEATSVPAETESDHPARDRGPELPDHGRGEGEREEF